MFELDAICFRHTIRGLAARPFSGIDTYRSVSNVREAQTATCHDRASFTPILAPYVAADRVQREGSSRGRHALEVSKCPFAQQTFTQQRMIAQTASRHDTVSPKTADIAATASSEQASYHKGCLYDPRVDV